MSALLSPYAPLWPWLVPHRESRILGILYRIFPETCRPLTEKDIGTPSDRLVDGIDLRDLATRAVVLRALASIGYACQWALGVGFGSDLSDEQAGRVVAEMVRCVGPDSASPVRPLPTGVLGSWRYVEGHDWIRVVAAGAGRFVLARDEAEHSQRDRELAAHGLLTWEQVTP